MKVVAVSANAAEQDRERCRQMGFNGFLAKPLDEQELFDILADQLPLTWGQPIEAETSATSSPADPPMVVPPLPDLQILYELAMFGSLERIEEKAAQLDELDDKYLPFTNRLRRYTRKFDDERIIELIKAAMEQAP
jgi:CheY-like chemotaxis protein